MKSKKLFNALPMILFCALSLSPVGADEHGVGNVEAGKQKSVLCLGCHGVNGEGKVAADEQPAYPRLATQIPGYFIKSLKDYKHDIRKDPLMNALAKSLTEADIANLAAYYATLD
jgi:cytochrome c553